jgi:hypothetical protein
MGSQNGIQESEKNRRYEGGTSCPLPHIPENFNGIMKKTEQEILDSVKLRQGTMLLDNDILKYLYLFLLLYWGYIVAFLKSSYTICIIV